MLTKSVFEKGVTSVECKGVNLINYGLENAGRKEKQMEIPFERKKKTFEEKDGNRIFWI